MIFTIDKLSKNFPFTVCSFASLDSTSAYLKRMIASDGLQLPAFCLAESQVSGYGQRGKTWMSTDDSLTCSFAIPFTYSLSELSHRSIPPALIVRRLLEQFSSSNCSVKWPNDIFIEGNKVAGCLMEVIYSKQYRCNVVVFGLGVNLSQKGLSEKYGFIEDLFVHNFLSELGVFIYEFFSNGEPVDSSKWLLEWEKYDYFSIDQPVIVYDNGTKKQGIYQGLNAHFQPEVFIDGELHSFNSGQVSIRRSML